LRPPPRRSGDGTEQRELTWELIAAE
jgi:hypothetical protein